MILKYPKNYAPPNRHVSLGSLIFPVSLGCRCLENPPQILLSSAARLETACSEVAGKPSPGFGVRVFGYSWYLVVAIVVHSVILDLLLSSEDDLNRKEPVSSFCKIGHLMAFISS